MLLHCHSFFCEKNIFERLYFAKPRYSRGFTTFDENLYKGIFIFSKKLLILREHTVIILFNLLHAEPAQQNSNQCTKCAEKGKQTSNGSLQYDNCPVPDSSQRGRDYLRACLFALC